MNTDLPKMGFLQDWVDEYDNTHREVIPDKPTITDNRTMSRDAPDYKPLKPNKIIKLKSSTIKAYTYSVENMYEKSSGEPTATVGSETPAKAVNKSAKSKLSQKAQSGPDEPNSKGSSKTQADKEESKGKDPAKFKAESNEQKEKDPTKTKSGKKEQNSKDANNATAVTKEAKIKDPIKAKAVTNEHKDPIKAKAVTNEHKDPIKAKALTNEPIRPRNANSRMEVLARQYKPQKQKVIGGVTMNKAQILRAESLYKQTLQTSENAILYGKQEHNDTKLPIVHKRKSANYEAARQACVAARLSTPKIWPTEYKEKVVTKVPKLVPSARSNGSNKVGTPRPTISKRKPTQQERTDTPRPDLTVQRFEGPRDPYIEQRVVPLAKLREYLKSGQIPIIRRIKHPRMFDLRTFVQSPLETIHEVDEEVEVAEEVELAEAEAMEAAGPDVVSGEVSPSRMTPTGRSMAEIFAAFFPETSISAVAIAHGEEREVKSEPAQLVSNGKANTCDDTLPIHSVPAPTLTTPLQKALDACSAEYLESYAASKISCLPDNPDATETEPSLVDAPIFVAEMPGLPDKDLLLANARATSVSYSFGMHSHDDNPKSFPIAASPIATVSCSPDLSGRSSVASSRPKSVLSAPPEAAIESSTDFSVSKQMLLNVVNDIPSTTQVAADSWVEGKAPTPQAERKPASRSSSVNTMRGRSLRVALIPARLSNTVAAVPVPPSRPRTSPQTKHSSARRNRTNQQNIDVPEEDVTNTSEHVSRQMEALYGQVRVDVMAPHPPLEAKSGSTRPSRRHKMKGQSQGSSQESPTMAKPIPNMKNALKAPNASQNATGPNPSVHWDPYTGEREHGTVSNQLMKSNAPRYGANTQCYEPKHPYQYLGKPYYGHKPKRPPLPTYEPKPPDEHNDPNSRHDIYSPGTHYEPKPSAQSCLPKPEKPTQRRHQTFRYRTAASVTPHSRIPFLFKSALPVDDVGISNNVRHQLPRIDSIRFYTTPTK